MSIIKKIATFILLVIFAPIIFFVLLQTYFYATYPIYKFEEPKPFSGNHWYNPYQDIDANNWHKAIFHLHSRSWWGITDGDNSKEEVFAMYKKLGYDVVTLSNYMKIDTFAGKRDYDIRCYEHGYNKRKTHQLLMGVHGKVLWRDYMFEQNLSQKQYTIDLLKKRGDLVALNHPDIRDGYWPHELKYLCNYDLFEVLNGMRLSVMQWDSTLSNGHAAWITANDDSHSVSEIRRVQRYAVFINSPSRTKDTLFDRFSHGKAFGMSFGSLNNVDADWKIDDLETKIEHSKQVSFPKNIAISDSIFTIEWERPMTEITFYGDHGTLLQSNTNTQTATYTLRPENTYVRVEIISPEGFRYYLNPIVRTPDGHAPAKQQLASIDERKTAIKFGSIIFVIAIFGTFAFFLIRCKDL